MWYLKEKVNDEVYFCHVEKHRNWYDKLILPYWMCVSRHSRNKKFTFLFLFVFFYQGFLSQTLTIHRTAVEGRGPSFIPLYHLHPLTKLRHLFATLHVRWLSRIFNCNAHAYQTATQWDLPPHRITIWLISWWWNVYLFTWKIIFRFFVTAVWHGKPVDLNLHRLSPLY